MGQNWRKDKGKAQHTFRHRDTTMCVHTGSYKSRKPEVVIYRPRTCEEKKKALTKHPQRCQVITARHGAYLRVVCSLVRISLEKTNFSFTSGYQMEIAFGYGWRSVSTSLRSRTPSETEESRPCACTHGLWVHMCDILLCLEGLVLLCPPSPLARLRFPHPLPKSSHHFSVEKQVAGLWWRHIILSVMCGFRLLFRHLGLGWLQF